MVAPFVDYVTGLYGLLLASIGILLPLRGSVTAFFRIGPSLYQTLVPVLRVLHARFVLGDVAWRDAVRGFFNAGISNKQSYA